MRSILITGCSSGIGQCAALHLAKRGWQIHATVRKAEDGAPLKTANCHVHLLDYADAASVEHCFDSVMEITGGTLDALFNNGAYGQQGAVEDLTRDVMREQFEANFFGWHQLTNLAVPIMRRQGHGRIIHCSSILGWLPLPGRGAYNASKFALEGLASTQRIELRGTGIHVSLIEPGPIATKFSDNALAKFLETVDWENSPHTARYRDEIKRLKDGGGVNKFRLPSEAVVKKLEHALTAKRPAAHYRVTTPTYMMDAVRRFLPARIMDRMLAVK